MNLNATKPGNRNLMSILAFNVCGLISKLKYDIFVDKLKEHDIVCVCETKADRVDEINLNDFAERNNYTCYSKTRKNARRKSSGICTLISNKIKSHVKELSCKIESFQSFIIKRECFNTDKDIILCNMYVPPQQSLYANDNIFVELELQL